MTGFEPASSRGTRLKSVARLALEEVPMSEMTRLAELPARVALVGAEAPWIGAFRRRVTQLNFVLDDDINQPDRIARIPTELGLPVAPLLDQAQNEVTKTASREQTEQARQPGMFGAPTFFVRAEMFWSDDRLDGALAIASGREPA
jgi:2-hydroxychromene-2-carboxylate isomerase